MIILKIIICIFLSPLAAFMQVGLAPHFWINLILWLAGFGLFAVMCFPFPIIAIIHAFYLVFSAKST